MREDQVCEHLRNLNIHKSLAPDEMKPRVLRELTDVVAKELSTLLEKSRQSDDNNLSTSPLPGKVMEQMFLVGMLKHVEKREVIQDPQGFTESKFCLTSLTLFYDRVTTLVDERKAMDAINPFLYFWVLWDFHQIQ